MIETNKFDVYNYGSKLDYGKELILSNRISVNKPENSELKELVLKNNLNDLLEQSKNNELSVFNEMDKGMEKWHDAAYQTALIKMALEYNNVPKIKHSNNEWVKNDDCNVWTVSNAVYRMWYDTYVQTKYNKELHKSEPIAWIVSWYVYVNSPKRNFYDNSDNCIASQSKKRFTDEAKAEKYINGRKAAFEHLFKEEYPAIPPEYGKYFKVNGMLLPNYKIQEGEINI